MNNKLINTKPLKIAAVVLVVIVVFIMIADGNDDKRRLREQHLDSINGSKEGVCVIAAHCLLQFQMDHPEDDDGNWISDFIDYAMEEVSDFKHEKPMDQANKKWDIGIYIISKGTGCEGPVLVGYSDITGTVDNEPYLNAIFIRDQRVFVVQQFKEKN